MYYCGKIPNWNSECTVPTVTSVVCFPRCNVMTCIGSHCPFLSFPYISSPPQHFSPWPCAQAFQPLTSHWQLTSSCLPTLCVPAVYLTPVWPGCEEQSCVYLPRPLLIHPLSGPPLPGAGTLWSLALSLPSDWRLTTGARGGKIPKVSFHQLCKTTSLPPWVFQSKEPVHVWWKHPWHQ